LLPPDSCAKLRIHGYGGGGGSQSGGRGELQEARRRALTGRDPFRPVPVAAETDEAVARFGKVAAVLSDRLRPCESKD
jgi:hypothetical protein